MAKYQAVPGANVLGSVVIDIVEALDIYKETGYQVLAECGIADPSADQPYPLQALCDFFEQVETRFGPATLSVMGKNVAKAMPVPPGINSPGAALSHMDETYQHSHQNVPPDEGWQYEETGPASAQIVCNAPYPDDFCRGIIEGIAKRFKPADGGMVKAEIDESKPRRDTGGQSVTVLVSW